MEGIPGAFPTLQGLLHCDRLKVGKCCRLPIDWGIFPQLCDIASWEDVPGRCLPTAFPMKHHALFLATQRISVLAIAAALPKLGPSGDHDHVGAEPMLLGHAWTLVAQGAV
jgi:hypothetical protein